MPARPASEGQPQAGVAQSPVCRGKVVQMLEWHMGILCFPHHVVVNASTGVPRQEKCCRRVREMARRRGAYASARPPACAPALGSAACQRCGDSAPAGSLPGLGT